MTKQSLYQLRGSGCLVWLLIGLGSLLACHTQRQVQISRETQAQDSAHVVDSFNHLVGDIYKAWQQQVDELSSKQLTFQSCPPCNVPDSILVLLDSAARWRIMLWQKDQAISDLNNKVKVNKDGSLEASGRIQSLQVSNSRAERENESLHAQVDDLTRERDSLRTARAESKEVEIKYVSRTLIPWWIWVALALLFIANVYTGGKLWAKVKAEAQRIAGNKYS